MTSDPDDPSSSPPTEKELKRLHEALDKASFASKFAHHSERGAALSIVAMLDASLSDLIQDRMVKDHEVAAPMFHEGQPLGAFGSKIRLAYLIGLYSKSVYNDLHIVGKIRNAFAHKAEADSFSYDQIASWVNNMTILKHLEDKEMELTGGIEKPHEWGKILDGFDVSKPRWKFMLSVALLTSLMNTTKTLREDLGWPAI